MSHAPLEAVLDRGDAVRRELDGVRYITYPALDELTAIRALTTLRQPAASPFAATLDRWDERTNNLTETLRLHRTVGRWLVRAFDVPEASFASGRQVHEDHYVVVGPANAPAPDELCRFDQTDALMTAQPRVALVVLTADCVPIFLADAQTRAVCCIHAGKVGTRKQIALQVANAFFEKLGARPQTTRALLGPSIGDGCYPPLPLWRENLNQLQAAGVETIVNPGLCTRCNPEHCYSYRAEKGFTGRMLSAIIIA